MEEKTRKHYQLNTSEISAERSLCLVIKRRLCIHASQTTGSFPICTLVQTLCSYLEPADGLKGCHFYIITIQITWLRVKSGQFRPDLAAGRTRGHYSSNSDLNCAVPYTEDSIYLSPRTKTREPQASQTNRMRTYLRLLVNFDVVLRQRDLQVLHHRIQRHWFSHMVGGHEHVVTCRVHTAKGEQGCKPANNGLTRK